MKISVHHIDSIQYSLYKAIENGEQWMSYLHPGKEPLEPQSIETWNSKETVERYCGINNNEQLVMSFARIEPFLQEMHKAASGNMRNRPDTINVNTHNLNEISNQQNTQQINHLKNIIMNEKNFDYLSNQLKYTGFSEDLQAQLKEKMQKQDLQFTLNSQKEYGKDQTIATLHFKRSEQSDMYFFNRYSLVLKNEQHPEPLKQTFYIGNKNDNISLKEAYNLMSGRAVHKELSNKEGEKYNAWMQIDFKETDANGNYKMKQFHENYKYDLPAILGNHPIKEMSNETDKQRLIESLQRGNRQSVTLTVHGSEQKVFIEAAPQFKSLNFYEASGQRIRTDQLYERNEKDQSMKQDEKKQSMKQKSNDNDEAAPEPSQKKAKRKGQTIT